MKAIFGTLKNSKTMLGILMMALLLSACEQPPVNTSIDKVTLKALSEEADGLLVKFDELHAADAQLRKQVLDGLNLKEAESLGVLAPEWVRVILKNDTTTLSQAFSRAGSAAGIVEVEPNFFVFSHNAPNDALFPLQNTLHADGVNSAMEDVDVDMLEAWALESGKPVVIAVIDTGVDIAHPDLVDRMWVNADEIDGNALDDDGNGYIDDVYGWNFVAATAMPLDNNGHGTHVAGIIGATSDNDIGIAGVNRNARIMPLKFMNEEGVGTVSTAIKALQYAADNGASVSNLSWGTHHHSLALYDAIESLSLINHTVVASAGNEGVDLDVEPMYPAAFGLNNILSVAAINERAQLASFSNYSSSGKVHLAAPGVAVLSTLMSDEQQEGYPQGYGVMSGTSASAAIVSGVVSLMLSRDETLDSWSIKQKLFGSTDETLAMNGKVAASGIVNAFGAVSSIDEPQWTGRIGSNNNAGETSGPFTGAGVTLSPSILTMGIGDQFELMMAGGVAPFSFETSDVTIASVNDAGIVTAHAAGEVQITATDADAKVSNTITILVSSLSVTPAKLSSLLVGDVVALEVSGGSGSYEWAVSGDGNAVELVVDTLDSAFADLTALQPGVFQFAVRDTETSSVLLYTSNFVTVMSDVVKITAPATTTLLVDEVVQLGVSSLNGSNIQWSSSDPNVASIDSSGVVSAHIQGSVTITATDVVSGKTDTLALTINQLPIAIDVPAIETLWVGNSNQVQLNVTGGNGPYIWASDSTNTVSVDNTGLVTAINFTPVDIVDASRKVMVTVADSQGNTASMPITVNKTFIAAAKQTVAIDEVMTLDVLAAGSTYQWSVSGNGTVLLNSATGEITGSTPGEVIVTITDANGNTASTQAVSVNALPLAIVEPVSRVLWVGDASSSSIALTASNGDGSYTWSTQDVNIVDVNAGTGVVSGLASGTAIVRVTDSAGNSNTIDLTVKKLTVSASTNTITAYDELLLSTNSDDVVSWSVATGASIATINQAGLLQTSGAGQVDVVATDVYGNTATYVVNVNALPVLVIENISVNTLWLDGQNTIQLSATGGKAPYTWKVTGASQGVISVNSNGLVTALSEGNGTVVLTDSVGNIDTFNVQVVNVTLSASSTSLKELETLQLNAQGQGQLSFSVSGDGEASVDGNTQVLTATKAGNITVTVTDENGASSSIDLAIIAVDPVSISASGSTTIWTGDNANRVQLSSNGGNGSISWSVVSGSSVVSVNSSGRVSAQSVGTAVVEATDAYGRTDTISITVKEVVIDGASTVDLIEGDIFTFTGDGAGSLNWSVSSANATITSGGVLTAVTAGSVTVTMVDSNNNAAVNSITVNITAPATGGGMM